MFVIRTDTEDEIGGESFEDFQAAAYNRPSYGRQNSKSAPSSPRGRRRHDQQLCGDFDNVLSQVTQKRRDFSKFHNKSESFRLDGHEFRPRLSSMPSHHRSHSDRLSVDDDDMLRLRMFSSTPKGVVNRGDSFKRRASSTAGSSNQSSVASLCSGVFDDEAPYKVLVMGPVGVGKSSLIQQFTTSEDMGAEEAPEDESGCAVPVMLDDKESVLIFKELLSGEAIPTSGYDVYLLIYCIDNHKSYEKAIASLCELRKSDTSAAVILVANKADMERHRKVKQEDAKHTASHYGCKYIEVSTVLNMKVDELLAGILKQIRLTAQRQVQKRKQKKKEEHLGRISASGLVRKIFRGSHSDISKSVEDLMVL